MRSAGKFTKIFFFMKMVFYINTLYIKAHAVIAVHYQEVLQKIMPI